MCNCRWNCTAVALVISVIVGVVTAFLQILGLITVGTAFLWVALGVAVVYLAALLVAAALRREGERMSCFCRVLDLMLTGVLGTALVSLILLAVGTVTGIFAAAAYGLLLFFLWLILTASVCGVRCLFDCGT